mmetsp:Transcript_31831/g.108018  ORF Transcript_31831/g.108018 Transcript_31831/m.108018 type:complete len:192 (-) Transcript_31831:23-598(-)
MTDAQMDFSRLVGVLTSSGVWLANIVALAGLACYMFAVLGMIFFRKKVYALDGDAGAAYARADRGAGPGARACPAAGRRLACRGRFNFDSFPMAFMTVVLVASLDGWNDVLYAALRAATGSWDRAATFAYFALVVVSLRYVAVSMIIAIVFDQVERDSVMVVRRNARVTMVAATMVARAADRAAKRRAGQE